MMKKILTNIPLILLILSMIYIGIMGVMSVDFGYHWDEALLIRYVSNSVETGVLLPSQYIYPSVYYDIAMMTVASHIFIDAVRTFVSDDEFSMDEIKDYVGTPAFKLELRSIFFLLCVLSGLAIYLFVSRLSGNTWTALLAALTLITSWEFVYHARWIVTDCLVLLFVSWAVMSQHRILISKDAKQRRFWLIVASVFTGLCMGAKYPGGIMIISLIVAVLFAYRKQDSNLFHLIRRVGLVIILVAVIFVVTTPGSVLEKSRFLRDFDLIVKHNSRGHGGYTVDQGWEHLSKLFIYIFTVMLSKNTILAIAASLSAIAGIVYLFRSQKKIAIWLLSVPVSYIAYMSSYRVMIVRNYLLLLPFLAVFTSLGISALIRAVKARKYLRLVLCGATLFFIICNISILTESAFSIIFPNTVTEKATLEKHITSSPKTIFYLSPTVRKLLTPNSLERYANIAESVDQAERFIFVSNEVTNWELYGANVPGRYETIWKKVEEVNYDYYPGWSGYRRVLEISTADRELKPLIDNVVLGIEAGQEE